MLYQLPPDIDQRVQSQIALGIYNTPAEVLKEALDALDQRNEDLASIQRGLNDEQAGRLTPLDDEFAAELRGRVDAHRCGELADHDLDEARAIISQRLAESCSK